jgi:hypothetical protein
MLSVRTLACPMRAFDQIHAGVLADRSLVKASTLKVLPGLPHGLCTTHKEQVNAELLTFVKNGGFSHAC